MITDYLYHLGILDLMEEMIPLDLVVIAIQTMSKMTVQIMTHFMIRAVTFMMMKMCFMDLF